MYSPIGGLPRDDSDRKRRRGRNSRLEALLTKVLLFFLALPPFGLYTYRNTYHNEEVSQPVEQVKELEPWESPIIHIINTRFMQNQGNLTTLATARLHLFKTVCLPSILHQSYHDFLWFIKIDPNLDEGIRNELIHVIHDAVEILLLESERRNTHAAYGEASDAQDTYTGTVSSLRDRIFVIGSNTNYGIGHDIGSWRGGIVSEEVLSHHSKDQIYMGNVDLLRMAQKAEPEKVVLETRLDADDGLNEGYVAYLHRDSMKRFHGITDHESSSQIKQEQHGVEIASKADSYKWFYWCVETHFKWYLNAEGEYGQLAGERRKSFCVTPGLTVGYNVGTSLDDVPSFPHHELVKNLQGNRSCFELGDENQDAKDRTAPCVELVHGFIGAVRARTATSAGMDDIKGKRSKEVNEDLWDVLEDRFDIMMEDAIEVKQYFKENLLQIAKENLIGQCRPGHSCKESSQTKLKRIIESSGGDDKDGLVSRGI